MGRVKVPFANIFSFSHKCGSGENGANPNKTATTIKTLNEILSNHAITWIPQVLGLHVY
jgi:hypothetical protein